MLRSTNRDNTWASCVDHRRSVQRVLEVMLLVLISCLLLGWIATGAALAATISVNDASAGTGGPNCKLRDAITAANTDALTGGCSAGAGADTIQLQTGATYSLNVVDNTGTAPNGLPVVTTAIVIEGAGSIIERSSLGGTPKFRLIQVDSAGDLTLNSVTIRNGKTPPGANDATNGASGGGGGAIANQGGTLTLNGCTVSGNTTGNGGTGGTNGGDGGDGGAIANQGGTLTLNDCTISGNTTGNGGTGGTNGGTGGDGGAIFSGGDFLNGSATLTVNRSIVSGNLTGNGADGGTNGGTGGFGGGIFSGNALDGGGTLTVSRSTISGNLTGDGAHGGTNGGTGGVGGGIFTDVILTATDTAISGNTTGNGGTGNTNGGSGGSGGGVGSLLSGTLTLTRCTVSNNLTGGGGTGGINAGPGGSGGGVSGDGTLTLDNSTVSGNITGNGASGAVGGNGGGIANGFGSATLNGCTVSGNTTGGGGQGGGIMSDFGLATIKNTIVANNTAPGGGIGPDCFGNITSSNYNLIEDTAGCTITGTTTNDITGTDPMLGPLQDNGGSTQTHALLAGSPAIDKGNPAGCQDSGGTPFSEDQRGAPREVDGDGSDTDECDIGAFEFLPCPLTPATGCTSPSKKAIFQIQDKSDDSKDKLKFLWKGDIANNADFGTPDTTTSYNLCIYGISTGSVARLLRAPAEDNTCGSKPCWKVKPNNKGYKYKDKTLTDAGLAQVKLKPGTGGKALIKIQAKGVNISEKSTLPDTLPLAAPPEVTVQLIRNDDPTKCWEAVFPEAAFKKNAAEKIKAKTP